MRQIEIDESFAILYTGINMERNGALGSWFFVLDYALILDVHILVYWMHSTCFNKQNLWRVTAKSAHYYFYLKLLFCMLTVE